MHLDCAILRKICFDISFSCEIIHRHLIMFMCESCNILFHICLQCLHFIILVNDTVDSKRKFFGVLYL